MKTSTTATFFLAALLVPWTVPAQTGDEIPVKINKISNRAAVFAIQGVHATNIAAIKTNKGIVVIDAEISPAFAAAIRKAIEKEFGAKISYLLLTHAHRDHTGGAQVFADAEIIAHESSFEEIKAADAQRERQVAQIESALQQMKPRHEKMEPGSPQASALSANISYYKQMLEDLKHGFRLTLPATTFSDRKMLDLGDVTLVLTYFGVAHSQSDILAYCPEEKLLATGDLFYPQNPLYIDSERVPFMSRWIEVLEETLNSKDGIDYVIPGHEDLIQASDLQAQLDYIKAERPKFHGKQSGMNVFKDLYDKGGADAALARLRGMKSLSDRYYVLHPELDSFAFRLMMQNKLDEALEIFLVLAELFPESATAFDSLGELYLRKGDNQAATANFEKSLKLDSENENAKRRLAELKK